MDYYDRWGIVPSPDLIQRFLNVCATMSPGDFAFIVSRMNLTLVLMSLWMCCVAGD